MLSRDCVLFVPAPEFSDLHALFSYAFGIVIQYTARSQTNVDN